MDYAQLALAAEQDFSEKDLHAIREFLAEQHPADLAAQLAEWPVDHALRVLGLLSIERQAKLFGYFDADDQLTLTERLPDERLALLFSEMNADERADLYAELPATTQQALLRRLGREEQEDIRTLTAYADETAGAIMTTDFVSLRGDMTVQQALDALREQAPDSETIYRAYVVNETGKLVGALRLQNLLFASRERSIAELIEPGSLSVHVEDDQEQVARQIAKYDVLALPVVDSQNQLVGIITHDDAMDVAEEEATEDFHKAVSVGKLDVGLKDAPLWLLYRKRIVWLVVLVFANIFSGAGIAHFEDTIAAYVTLVFFLPLLIDSGGNAGAQAATLMVRGLATGDVMLRDWGGMLGRELLVAIALGLTMAAAVSGIGVFRGGPDIAMVVSVTMVLVVMFGSLVGMSLPFVLSRMRLDPATASAPLITSIADIGGVLIYFSIATAVLGLPAIE